MFLPLFFRLFSFLRLMSIGIIDCYRWIFTWNSKLLTLFFWILSFLRIFFLISVIFTDLVCICVCYFFLKVLPSYVIAVSIFVSLWRPTLIYYSLKQTCTGVLSVYRPFSFDKSSAGDHENYITRKPKRRKDCYCVLRVS